VWHSTRKYRRTIWQCNKKFRNDDKYGTPHLYEDDLKRAFVDAFNSIVGNKKAILNGYDEVIQVLTDNTALYDECAKLQDKIAVLLELIRKCVDENAHAALDEEEYQRHYNELATRYESIKKRLTELDEQRLDRRAKHEKLSEFIGTLVRCDGLLTEFDEGLWNATVESVTVRADNDLTFMFKNGKELSWII
jgi:predicted nuclease with TOPRIM domain